VKTSERYDGGAHLREGVRRVMLRFNSTQQCGSSDYSKAVLKWSKGRRGVCDWTLKHAKEEEGHR